jgi:hypothetical protein
MIATAPIEKVTIEVQGKKIVLDPLNMKYNENSLAEYMNQEYGWIDYLGKQLEYANKELALAEIEYDFIFSKKCVEIKDSGASDTYSKCAATANEEVKKAKIKVVDRREAVGHLRAHLKAWDRNHENVQNRGHSLRAEMKVLNREFYSTPEDSSQSSFGDYLK